MTRRRFIDAPPQDRCAAVIVLKDKTTADCGRRRKTGSRYCWQHAKGKKP